MLPMVLLGACRTKPVTGGEHHVARVGSAVSLDKMDDATWGHAPRIEWGPAGNVTEFRALWNDAGLFVRFDVHDAKPWHRLTRHDDKLWEEEVVEIFLMPPGASGAYGEVEISPANVTCDVWVTPAVRHFELAWNLEGLQSRVTTQTEGWTASAFFPWSGFAPAAGEAARAPRARERWRFNVFRIERPGGPERPEQGALFLAWSPTGQSTFHVPEAFRGMVFDE